MQITCPFYPQAMQQSLQRQRVRIHHLLHLDDRRPQYFHPLRWSSPLPPNSTLLLSSSTSANSQRGRSFNTGASPCPSIWSHSTIHLMCGSPPKPHPLPSRRSDHGTLSAVSTDTDAMAAISPTSPSHDKISLIICNCHANVLFIARQCLCLAAA